MEDATRKVDLVLRVERCFEPSRLEGDVMASAYGGALPLIRAAPDRSTAEPVESGSVGPVDTAGQTQGCAMGA